MNDTRTIDVGGLIDASPVSGLQVRVFILCCLVAVLDGVDSFSIGIAAPSIASKLGIPLSGFGPVFSAAVFGATLGAFTFGPLADRFGRKPMLLVAVLLFSAFTVVTALVPSYDALLAVRFLAGIGLGGATPCFLTLAAEYAPARLRATVTSALWAGFPLGGMIGSFFNGWLIARYDWPALFYVGGIAPLLVAAGVLLLVPESVRYLTARIGSATRTTRIGSATRTARIGSAARVGVILRRIAPGAALGTGPLDETTRFVGTEDVQPGAPVRNLFTAGRALATPLLWLPFFMAFGVLIVVTLWTPALLRQQGMPAPDAAFVVAIHGAGGFLGMAAAGRLFERFGMAALVPAFLLGAVFTFALGRVGISVPLAAACDGLIGVCVGIGASGVIAMAAVVYPTAIRSAGIGWAMGMGRLGQVCAPLLVGALLGAGWMVPDVFAVVAAGPVIAALVAPLALRLFRAPHLAALAVAAAE